MRGLRLLLVSTAILAASILFTVLFVDGQPEILFVTVPVMIAAFFGALQPLMWAMSRIGLPRPEPGTVAVDSSELRRRLLALTDEDSPFDVEELADGRIVCSWKIADARWYELFAKVRLKQDYQLQLLPVPEIDTVRAIEVTKRFSKRVSPTRLSISLFSFRGWAIAQIQKEAAWGLKEIFPPEPGKLYEIDFSAKLFRAPVLRTIVEAGWTIQPCTFSLGRGI